MTAEKSLAVYFDEAASWDADRAAQAARSARIAWAVALAAVFVAVAASCAHIDARRRGGAAATLILDGQISSGMMRATAAPMFVRVPTRTSPWCMNSSKI